ncbi:hypothetical protein HDU76_012931 [Blyttiomyces sp. JEL0837]|nr:hypothetical protein HDU76_012931 [Blyttiomyces sp. JEL0837]
MKLRQALVKMYDEMPNVTWRQRADTLRQFAQGSGHFHDSRDHMDYRPAQWSYLQTDLPPPPIMQNIYSSSMLNSFAYWYRGQQHQSLSASGAGDSKLHATRVASRNIPAMEKHASVKRNQMVTLWMSAVKQWRAKTMQLFLDMWLVKFRRVRSTSNDCVSISNPIKASKPNKRLEDLALQSCG